MATITSFSIENFKGAAKATIKFSNRISTPVVTLIGLNESGKTTILEALSYFVSGDNAVSSLFKGSAPASIDSLIPIHKKAAFTGDILINANVIFSAADKAAVVSMAAKHNIDIEYASLPDETTVSRSYEFNDSVLTKSWNLWQIDFKAKMKAARRFRTVNVGSSDFGELNLWDLVAETLSETLPRIAYFPTFLVDLPKKIYLREHEKEAAVNRYYRLVLQDVLDSLDEGLSLEKHVCDRIEAFRIKDATPNWFSILFGGPSKGPIDAVFQRISDAVTKEVLGSWENIFSRKIAAKSIIVEWHIDTEKDNMPYATFSITDGASKYAIDQRSLGFRWFFSFLLFTTFKQKADRPTIFVFDEPAANLHAKAQAELLKSFSRITTGEHKVVYSTHSHHMINPHWLSGSYIVENTAIDHDADDSFGLTTQPTNIIATSYREFVAKNPTRTSYFQPVIEQLEFITPELLGSDPFLVVEGITDYYALSFLYRKQGRKGFALMPGLGAGASGPLISSMMGRGERFTILLDDDTAGRVAAKRYKEQWFLTGSEIMTLVDVNPKFSGTSLENLLSKDTKSAIAQKIGKSKPTKKEIGWYLAELCADASAPNLFDQETCDNLNSILDFTQKNFVNAVQVK